MIMKFYIILLCSLDIIDIIVLKVYGCLQEGIYRISYKRPCCLQEQNLLNKNIVS